MNRYYMSRIFIITLVSLMGAVLSASAGAEACTYREAIMALEQGNSPRGMALMRMASSDGNSRAAEFLMRQGDIAATPTTNLLIEARAKISINKTAGNTW